MNNETIKLAHGSGGREMQELIEFIRMYIPYKGKWECTGDDSSVLGIPPLTPPYKGVGKDVPPDKGEEENEEDRKNKLVFTTDSFVVSPIFFSGGNIGDLAFNGTVNDLLMQGAKPLGVSLAIVIEEGFLLSDLKNILKSIGDISQKIKVPIATGDTKVVSKGALDKIMIITSGVGIASKIIFDSGLRSGDKIIATGTLGDHGAAILAHRFNYKTNFESDTRPLLDELNSVRQYITAAKDPTRGGVAAVINEMAEKSKVKIILDEEKIPVRKESESVCKLLGLNKYSLASEGRFIAGVNKESADIAVQELKKINKDACIIGQVEKGKGVFVKNIIGERKLDIPEGVIVPRIC